MSDDIEAAAKALALQFDLTYLRERNTCASEAEARTAGWLAVARHALAHAARGEGECDAPVFPIAKCEDPTCDSHGWPSKPGPWRCAIHHPEHPANTPPPATGPVGDYGVDPRQHHNGTHPQPWKGVSLPPPATGEAKCGWCGGQGYVEGSVNLRPYRIECVRCHPVATGPEIPMGGPVRIIATTPPPATGEECRWYTGNGEEYEILPPEEVRRRRIEAARRLRDVGPATGEAGTRGEVWPAWRVAFHRAWTDAVGRPGYDKGFWRELENAMLRALPEAREGKSKTHG